MNSNGSLQSYKRFEDLVARIFERLGFFVLRSCEIQRGLVQQTVEVDLLLTAGEVKSVVDVKMSRSRTAPLSQISMAMNAAKRAQHAVKADNALVVTNSRRDNLPLDRFAMNGVTLLAIEDLVALSSPFPELVSELVEMDRELSSALGNFDDGLTMLAWDTSSLLSDLKTGRKHSDANEAVYHNDLSGDAAPRRRGSELATELRSIPEGRGGSVRTSTGRQGAAWRLFEIVCYEAMQYVFEEHFHNWRNQEDVGGDMYRFDVIAKVKGTDVFSRMLIENFASRYVIFEFKNYENPLKSNIIHVTEKYLFPRALRATAIIVSPKGLTEAADRAAQGALRDAGKLMLSLEREVLCQMLEEKDHGTSPGLRLETILDSFLQQLGR